MITKITMKSWKSFDEAVLYIDPLTILIGTNASGKSNALDALDFLSRTAGGQSITSCLAGDSNLSPLRGGIEWSSRYQGESFRLGVIVREKERVEFEYNIEVFVASGRCEVAYEELKRRKFRRASDGSEKVAGEIFLFKTDQPGIHEPTLKARLYNKASGTNRQLSRSSSVLSQLYSQTTRQDIADGINIVIASLRGIFILDPIPSHMRDYSPLSDGLDADAGNIAGVIAALPDDRQREVERVFVSYLSKLPERDIRKVYTERVGKFESDAMLYCEENWVSDGDASTVDARGMSDGTLRFLAILTALLTRPEGTLLVIEEVDNGLHPSRSYLLIEMLKGIGEERNVDIVITTHNPALLDALGPEAVPYIVVAHRDIDSGASRLTLLENINNLAKVLGHGSLGAISSKGILERALRGQQLTFGF